MLRFGADQRELDVLWEDLGLRRFVAPCEIPYLSTSGVGRAAHREQVRHRLRADGWFARGGDLRVDIKELLRVWCEPDVVLTQVVTVLDGDHRFRYRGGWDGETGVLASQENTRLSFRELRPARVIEELMGFLPPWEPIDSPPVSYILDGGSPIPRPDPDAEFFRGIDAPLPRPPNGPREAQRFFAAHIIRSGAITCAIRAPATRTRPGREVETGQLTWIDTADGRYFAVTETLPDGAERHILTPADRARIAQWLRDRLTREFD